MKKIVAIVLFMFAYSFSVNAQTSLTAAKVETIKTNPKEAAYKDVSELTSIIEVTPEFKNDLMTLFMMREEAMQNAQTEDEKAVTYKMFGEKILSGLTEEQRKTLQEKPELYARLVKYKPVK
jgi:hypothetical protein